MARVEVRVKIKVEESAKCSSRQWRRVIILFWDKVEGGVKNCFVFKKYYSFDDKGGRGTHAERATKGQACEVRGHQITISIGNQCIKTTPVEILKDSLYAGSYDHVS